MIAPVLHAGVAGGYWILGYTSTDQVLSATRAIWGFTMKLADRIDLNETGTRICGQTDRLGSTLISLELRPTGKPLEVPDTFPRLFWKVLPQADRPETLSDQVVQTRAETNLFDTVWGDGSIDIQSTASDGLDQLGHLEVLGASFVTGTQVLPWGDVVG